MLFGRSYRHLAPPAVKMQSQTLPVVQKEQWSVWLYALEWARDVPVMDGADAEFVADAVFGAHEFCFRQRLSETWNLSTTSLRGRNPDPEMRRRIANGIRSISHQLLHIL